MENKSVYAALFMIVFLASTFLMAMGSIWSIRDKIEQPRFWNVIEGRWSLAFERKLDEAVPVKEQGTHFWGLINYAVFKDGKPGVLIGDDGWLFTNEEFMQYPGARKQLMTKVDFVKEVNGILNAHGVKLVIALIPAKARVYQDKLGRYKYPAYNENNYNIFRKEMKEAKIPVTDILWLMNEKKNEDYKLFLKTDTHWSLAGARMAARLVANAANEAYPGLIEKKTNYVVDFGEIFPHDGDLMRYVPLGRSAEDFGLERDSIKEVSVEAPMTAGGSATDDLFGDSEIPITLVGTSYSANTKWGFAGFLKEVFGTEVLNAADEGKGPFETMKQYLQDAAFKKTPPKLLVWEIPERFLPVKYDLELNGDK
ncbi:MAG: hypothetical protein EBQ96_00215 [Proteobacteria bacterium]|nr:hypothetical protein [Pseudomonadota bacterium]